ncbi:Protein FAM90A1 [Sciurus carolinensis]|uniref:Protein FAM90A1 n=1 Tax=Sciurus carolinensis TaxID=30640 RepID=A0AA41MJ15_SCICA|nr:Protein FAM90A1 [Sciurus carolinensis]
MTQDTQISPSEEERPDIKNMRQWAGHSSQPPSQRLMKTQNEKHQQRRAVGQRAPPPEEENPQQTSRPPPNQIPCKSSVLGPVLESQPPVKNTDERPILPRVQPFQRNEHDFYSIPVPMKGQEVAITGTSHPAVRRTGQNTALHVKGAGEKPEGGSLNVAQAISKSHDVGQVLHPQSTARGPHASKWPCLQATTWRSAQVPTLSIRAPNKRHAQDPVKAIQHAPKKLRGNTSLTPYWSTGRVEVYISVQCLPSTSGLRFKVSPHVTRESPPHGSSMDLHPPRKSLFLNPVPSCTKSNPPASSCVPRQTLRMVFRRLHHDCWSSGFIMTPPSSPLSKPNAPALSAPFLDKSEGHSSHVPVSCLYEDLQVSLSSDDSDME